MFTLFLLLNLIAYLLTDSFAASVAASSQIQLVLEICNMFFSYWYFHITYHIFIGAKK